MSDLALSKGDVLTDTMPETGNNNSHEHTHAQNRFAVIPTAEKIGAAPEYSGRDVTIAFLDSGFYPHPDLIDRVIAFHDISGEESTLASIDKPIGHHWHGTQTVVACAGNGSLSEGVYRGLAHHAQLVLVKVSAKGRIADASIEKGLRWVIENRERYGIRILNMSLGGDIDVGLADSCINRLTEELVASGVVVTVAAGNSAESRSIPPANAPSVITVGGYSDENQFSEDGFDLYHSSYGPTADGLVKPEIIAPAMYVAAPILPGTEDYEKAEVLSLIADSTNYLFREVFIANWQKAGLQEYILSTDVVTARQIVEQEMTNRKIVATHYQHVDGTSFAAPIAASVAAQMIEANPDLTPAVIKNILISTASRLSGHPAIRQGFGVLNARMAVEMALKETHFLESTSYFAPRIENGQILFSYHDDEASEIVLCGDFNGWRHDISFDKSDHGLWHAAIPCQPVGQYRYKFLIDGNRWTEDPSHGLKDEDGFGGFNSILRID